MDFYDSEPSLRTRRTGTLFPSLLPPHQRTETRIIDLCSPGASKALVRKGQLREGAHPLGFAKAANALALAAIFE
jgi:hypothetical protein